MQSVSPGLLKFMGQFLRARHTLQFLHLSAILTLLKYNLSLTIISSNAPTGHRYLQKNLGISMHSASITIAITNNAMCPVGNDIECMVVVNSLMKQ